MAERRYKFALEDSRYAVWRQGEWGFFVWCSGGENGLLHLWCDVMDPELDGIQHPRGFELMPKDSIDLELERRDGTTEEVTVTYDRMQGSRAILRFSLLSGVQMQWHEGTPATE